MTWLLGCWLVLAGCVPPQVQVPAAASTVSVPGPGPADTCPVCGMFVAKYRNWVATILWKDGRAQHFDGAKDLFTFLHALPKYAAGRSREDMRTVAVTEFYDVRTIDATQAFFVIGSDVLGPMGRELVPFATRGDAEEFLKDHHGTRILRYGEITPEIIRGVDDGRF